MQNNIFIEPSNPLNYNICIIALLIDRLIFYLNIWFYILFEYNITLFRKVNLSGIINLLVKCSPKLLIRKLANLSSMLMDIWPMIGKGNRHNCKIHKGPEGNIHPALTPFPIQLSVKFPNSLNNFLIHKLSQSLSREKPFKLPVILYRWLRCDA